MCLEFNKGVQGPSVPKIDKCILQGSLINWTSATNYKQEEEREKTKSNKTPPSFNLSLECQTK